MGKTKITGQRVTPTKRLVREALIEMLKTRNMNKISIGELCRVAGINRTTFYNHYGSQYDVLNEIAKMYIESTSLAVMKGMTEGQRIDACLVQVLHYIKDHAAFIKLILKQENGDLIDHITISLPQFDQMVIRNLPEEMEEDMKQAISSFVQFGTVRLLKEWIDADCARSPEEEVGLILKIAGRTICSA